MLCDQCSLIAHSKCAHNAPQTCDLRAQLLLYARHASGSSPLEPTPLEPSSKGFSKPRTSSDFGQPSAQRYAPPPIDVPRDFKELTAFKQSPSSPGPPAQSSSSVNPVPVPRERRTSPLSQNPLKLKGKEAAKLPPSTSLGPSNLRSHEGQEGSTNNTRKTAGTRRDDIVSSGNEAEAARLPRTTRHTAVFVKSDKGRERASPTGSPGLPSSPTTSRKRTQKESCLVQ